MNSKYAFALIMVGQLSVAGDLPNPKLTTGTINPEITQHNIQNTICVKGYTKTVRPPAYFTNKLKKKQIIEYGYEDKNPKHYEEDHLIPLSIGGSPDDQQNLWPQPRMGEWNAQKKDILEFWIYKRVCDGSLSLEEARVAFADNWIAAYKRFVLRPPNLNNEITINNMLN